MASNSIYLYAFVAELATPVDLNCVYYDRRLRQQCTMGMGELMSRRFNGRNMNSETGVQCTWRHLRCSRIQKVDKSIAGRIEKVTDRPAKYVEINAKRIEAMRGSRSNTKPFTDDFAGPASSFPRSFHVNCEPLFYYFSCGPFAINISMLHRRPRASMDALNLCVCVGCLSLHPLRPSICYRPK